MTETSITPIIGAQPSLDYAAPDLAANHPTGFRIFSNDSYLGSRELVYAVSSGAMAVGTMVVLSYTTVNGRAVVTATPCPTTIANGKPVYFAATAFSGIGQYGWFVASGMAIAAGDSALAVDAAAFAHATGRLGVTAVGKQITGIAVAAASTKTEVKQCNLQNGSTVIKPSAGNTDGWFVGMPLTGTGVGAATKIASIAVDGTVTVTVASTATSNAAVTGTYNDGTIFWHIVNLAFAQSVV